MRILTYALMGMSHVLAEQQESCLALALNGGGNKGAYQAGVMWGWNHYGNPEDFQWDVVSGISGGAINTGAMSPWAKEDGVAMTEWISDQWVNLTTPDIWVLWPGGLREGLTTAPSLVDASPMVRFLQGKLEEFDLEVKRHAMVGTVDINTGEYISYRLEDAPKD